MKYLFTLILFFFLANGVQAQNEVFTEDSIVFTEDFVRVFKDARLNALDGRAAALAKLEWQQKKEKSEAKAKEIPLYKPIVSADGKKQVSGSIYTVKGFRIVVYNGADKNAAIAAKNNFSRAFPGTRSYLSYNVPSYKIKVGDFENRNEASKFLRRINAAYPSAFIVPDIVTVKNINVTQ